MKTNDSRAGQVLVETCITLAAQVFAMSTLLLAFMYAATVVLMNLELYSLARSSLYQSPRSCVPSEHWPRWLQTRLNYHCEGFAQARGEFVLFSQVDDELRERLNYRTQVELRR
ncbi:MAG TPA: hypothetical protein VM901_09735 [Bdellovibrionota bacterium]|jgi:hypothetical protein|nr:hypothetical protein [Bdellovibrionota bacterium]